MPGDAMTMAGPASSKLAVPFRLDTKANWNGLCVSARCRIRLFMVFT